MIHGYAQKYDALFSGFLSSNGGVVHSVFPNAVNIASNGILYTLLSGKKAAAPCTANVDAPNFQALGIRQGDRAAVTENELVLGEKLLLHFQDAVLFQPFFPDLPYEYQVIDKSIATIEAFLIANRLAYGAVPYYLNRFIDGKTAESDCIQNELNLRMDRLMLAFPEQKAIAQSVKSLIGAGPGLTPSGDDFLCGLLLSLLRTKNPMAKTYSKTLAAGIETALQDGTTTDVSRQMLLLHVHGCAPELYEQFLKDVMIGEENLQTDLYELKQIGHSSGLDFVCGAASGLRLLRPKS